MPKFQYTFTVFTPTYNRAYTLHRVYESLMNQTFRDFEWLVVDDGSIDDSNKKLIDQWKNEAWFPIRYYYQINQGKHMAYNHALNYAQGEYFITLDSDDACVPNALERLKFHWDSIPLDERTKYCGVASLCMDEEGNIIKPLYPLDVIDSNSSEMKYKYRCIAERWGFTLTDILRMYPFPEIYGCYIPESYVWVILSRKYKIRCFNEPLRIFYSLNPKENRLSFRDETKHSLGHIAVLTNILNGDLKWFFYSPKWFAIYAAQYSRFSFHAQIGIFKQQRELKPLFAKFLWLVALPVGLLVFIRDLLRKR